MWFIGVEVEQEMSAPPREKNPRSAPDMKNFMLALLTMKRLSLVYGSLE